MGRLGYVVRDVLGYSAIADFVLSKLLLRFLVWQFKADLSARA